MIQEHFEDEPDTLEDQPHHAPAAAAPSTATNALRFHAADPYDATGTTLPATASYNVPATNAFPFPAAAPCNPPAANAFPFPAAAPYNPPAANAFPYPSAAQYNPPAANAFPYPSAATSSAPSSALSAAPSVFLRGSVAGKSASHGLSHQTSAASVPSGAGHLRRGEVESASFGPSGLPPLASLSAFGFGADWKSL